MKGIRSALKSLVTAAGLTYGSYVLGTILSILLFTILSAFNAGLFTQPSFRILLGAVILQGITFTGIAYLYLRTSSRGRDFVPVSMPDRREIVIILTVPLALVAVMAAIGSVFERFGIEVATNQVSMTAQTQPIAFLLLIPISFLIIGPGEELLYRGIIQGDLRTRFSPIPSILFASALFASIHLFALSGEGKFSYIILTFLLSLILGATYEYTENLTVPAVVHGAYNAILFGTAYVTAIISFIR